MKQNKMMLAALAMTALLMASCSKDPQGYDSFILNKADLRDASGAKAHWDASGYWWENNTNPEAGDVVLINGVEHHIWKDGSTWKTRGSMTSPENNQYYVAYAGPDMNPGNWNTTTHTYGPVNFDGSFVPMGIAGTTNRLTLYPCCAVLKITSGFAGGLNFEEVDGKICSSGYIDPANATIIDGESILDADDPTIYPETVGDYDYFIIPIEGNAVTCKIITDNGDETTQTLKKGVVYVINKEI